MKHNGSLQRGVAVAALVLPSTMALAQVEPPATAGDWKVDAKTAATFGAGVRTSHRKAGLLPGGKNNSDDGNLNYGAGEVFSRVTKVSSQVKAVHASGIGVALGGMAWYDDAALHHGVPHGNNPNDYVAGAPLSDKGFNPNAKFQGLAALNAHLYGQASVGGGPLDWKVGLISIERQRGFSFGGGLRDLETRNLAASSRPGAQEDEAIMPVWGSVGRWQVSQNLRLEGFWQFKPQEDIQRGCGTFFASNDYAPPGCNRVFYSNALSERQNVVNGVFTARSPDIKPDGMFDQAGLGLSYLVRDLGTRFGVYAAQYHSRVGYTSVRKGSGIGPTRGSTYLIEYPEDKRLLSFTTATQLPAARLTWLNEVSIIFNQPLQLNTSDLQGGFLTGKGLLGKDAIATSNGALYHGYDRFRVMQVQSGMQKEFAGLLGASKAALAFEIGLKHVDGLPDPNVRRYNRPEASDSCATAAECATNVGYTTKNAWGYRLRGSLDYVGVGSLSLRLRPTLQFAQDVKGWAYDYGFVQGRKTLTLGLDGEYGKSWFGNVSYSQSHGGQFNTRKDRDYAMVSAGYRF